MDLYEYQARDLFEKYEVPVLAGIVADTPEEAKAAAEKLGGVVVVKAQVKTGGRGKAGGVKVGAAATTGWVKAESRSVPVDRPDEGEGVVANRAGAPVAISTVDGVTRSVSAVCPHLGGVLDWNDAECTWDCPLHASRFAADGTRIEGPALQDLKVLPRKSGG